ncbi:MAG TPA: cache domain-containing protein [Aliidongia sp.]|nr:cache domain-containing protein [Aliidongia sp.]
MRAIFRGINGRILLIPVVALAALALLGTVSVRSISQLTLEQHQDHSRIAVEASVKIVEMYEAKAAAGELSEADAQEAAKAVLRAIRYDGNEYISVHDADNVTLVNGVFPQQEGKSSKNSQDANGVYFARDMQTAAESGGAYTYYVYPKVPNTPAIRKVAYNKLSPRWKWAVTSGVYLDDVDAASRANALRTIGAVSVLALITFALAFWLGRRIARPILGLTVATNKLAEGDLSVEIPGQDRVDEIGVLAQAIGVLREKSAEAEGLRAEQDRLKAEAAAERHRAMQDLADGFDASVRRVVDGIAASATEMESTANTMSAAAGETDGRTSSAAAAAEQTSSNVSTVAAATDELSASIHEIARQVTQSSEIAAGAVAETERTNGVMAELNESAKRVGDIVALIGGIASQTNLLALNATIEAARAGEAGKGFAVVASEVKALATQTAKATEEIQTKVAEIQSMTGTAVSAIVSIGRTVGQMNEITTAVAAAVEEQGAATGEIANSVQQAATGTREVSVNVAAAQRAASETGAAATTVLTAAGMLSREAEMLRTEVDSFLAGVRAA